MENVAPPNAYFDELTPNIHITIVDGKTHKCTFSVKKFAIYFNGNPAAVSVLLSAAIFNKNSETCLQHFDSD